jgi:predicted lipoprotein with Yx(FWY)xxD motif
MKRLIAPAIAAALALTIAACGGGSGTSSSSGGTATVSIKQLPGVGQVLVDRSGKALYTPDQEANGMILCSGSCTAFWKPVTPAGRDLTSGAGGAKLGVTTRPDGTKQVTANGRPLYTFTEDSPGKVTGNGFKDDFGGHHFTWHVVSAGGKTASTGTSTGSSSGGGSSGAYGY